MAWDKTCEKLITRKVLCFPASKLDALDSSLDTRSFRVSRIEDRVAKFEFRGTVNLHLHGTVPLRFASLQQKDILGFFFGTRGSFAAAVGGANITANGLSLMERAS